MIFTSPLITVSDLDNDGFVTLCFNSQTDSVNKFDLLTLDALDQALDALEATANIKGMRVTSGKPLFIVGADIKQFSQLFAEPEESIKAFVAEKAQIFNRVENLPFATVAVINGSALGGGYEMCLACDFRVLQEEVRIGLPEVKLGVNPGFGGTVRLPRLIGIDNALEWICAGNDIKSDRALADGGVDAVVAKEYLESAATEMLKQANAGNFCIKTLREEKQQPVKLNDMERLMAFVTGKALVSSQAGPHFPAPITAAKSIEKSAGLTSEQALEIEAKYFARLAKTPEAEALVGLFLNDQYVGHKAKKLEEQANPINKAGVLGAGIMGGGIAYQSAYRNTPVLMKDIQTSGLDLGMEEAAKLLAKRVDRGRMSALEMGEALNRIRPTLDYTGFDELDVVVEAVVENSKIKQSVLKECERHLSDNAVLASNTSTISISLLAQSLQRPENFCGMHFFNPVHKMPLVEVIRGAKTSDKTIATVVSYARKMGKTPIVVNDCAGFLVNRVLFPYLAAFNLLLKDGVDFQAIDKVMEKFGWPMGPAYLLDVVGLDTASHAAAVMADAYPDRMKYDFISASERLYKAEYLGQKNKKGFYQYTIDKKGRPLKLVDLSVMNVIGESCGEPITVEDQVIIERMMLPLCIEISRCLEDGIVATPAEADIALAMGIGFPLFRGGACRYMSQVGLEKIVKQAESYASLGALYKPTESMKSMAQNSQSYYPLNTEQESV